MRQQYHPRQEGADTLIWNVNRLITASAHLPVEEVPLDRIKEFTGNWWYQGADDVPTCRSVADHAALIQACDLRYPILLAPDGSVIDGMHRVCKAYLEGKATVRARRLPEMPPPDHRNVSLDDLPY